MLSSLVGPKATIRLVPYQSVLFIHPPKQFEHLDEDNAPPKDQKFWGSVTLVLPKPREFTSLVIKLVAYYTIAIPGYSSENGILAEFPCTVNIPSRLDKGEHTFAWQLNIPRTSAPYERCAFGRVYHKLHAIAEGPSGTIKEDVVLEVVVNPADEGETMGLNERIEGFSEEIGPYCASLSSGHVTVAGAVHYKLSLPSVPEDTKVHSITANIEQLYLLRSPSKPGVTANPQPHTRRVFRLDHTTPRQHHGSVTPPAHTVTPEDIDACFTPRRPNTVIITKKPTPPGDNLLAFIPKGESLEVSHVARLPDDDLLRPTTQEGTTDAPIKITHVLKISIEFATAASNFQRLLALRVERPMNMSSCCCMLESLLLPSYNDAQTSEITSLAGTNSRYGKSRPNCAIQCLCGYTMERLLAKQHAPLLKAHQDAASGNDRGGSDEIFKASKVIPPSYSPQDLSSAAASVET